MRACARARVCVRVRACMRACVSVSGARVGRCVCVGGRLRGYVRVSCVFACVLVSGFYVRVCARVSVLVCALVFARVACTIHACGRLTELI